MPLKKKKTNTLWEMLETEWSIQKKTQEKRMESSKCLPGICYVPVIKVLVDHDGKLLFYGQNHSRIQTIQVVSFRFKEREIEREVGSGWEKKYLAKQVIFLIILQTSDN